MALGALVSALLPAAREVRGRGGDIYAGALEAHVRGVVATLRKTTSLTGPIAQGKLRVVGASYDPATGTVTRY